MARRILFASLLTVALALLGGAVGTIVDDADWWPAAAGAAAGLVLGLVLAAVVIARGRGLRDGSEAQRISGLPLIAHVLPPGKSDAERRRADEAFRMLRAALALGSDEAGDPGLRVVAVTSAAPGEGKTTVAAGLGRALARAGRPVIVVEADLRRPGLATALGVTSGNGGTGRGGGTRGFGGGLGSGGRESRGAGSGGPTAPRQGLTAAIVGGVPVTDLLIDVEPGLQLLPAGELPPNAPELLGSADAARVLEELVALGTTIILDTAPLLPVADTRELLLHEATGRVIVVARPGVVHRAELRDAVALLPDGRPAILAVSGRARTPRSYDRYLRDSTRA